MSELEIAVTDSLVLRVCFRQLEDRITHQVLLVDRGASSSFGLAAVEGSEQQHWPASPALQQLALESNARSDPSSDSFGHICLLVGMAGKSHWSLSVEVQPSSSGCSALRLAAPHLTFDVACRLQVPPDRLGSTYRLPDAVEMEAVSERGEAERGVGWIVRRQAKAGPNAGPNAGPKAGPGLWIRSDAQIPTELVCQDRQFRIGPASVGPVPGTVRWRYHVGVEGGQ